MFHLLFYFFALSIERTRPDLHSLLIIPCMIVYVTNKQEPWTLSSALYMYDAAPFKRCFEAN